MDAATIDDAARVLVDRERTRALFEGFPPHLAPHTEHDAYAIQDRVALLRTAERGTARAGHKIGSTTPVMQRYLNIASPCSGIMCDDTVVPTGAEFVTPPHGASPRFTALRGHQLVPRAGHDLPQEAPEVFASAVLALL